MNWTRTAVAARYILVMLSQRTLLQMLQPTILDYNYIRLAKSQTNCWRRWLGAQGAKERGLLVSLVVDLPEVLRDEQLRKHQLAKLQDTRQGTHEPSEVIVFAHRLASRMQVAKQYYDYLRSCGWTEGEREPYGARRRFIERIRWVGCSTRDTLRTRTTSVGRWLRVF